MEFLDSFFKLLGLLLKVTKVTTGHQKWPKIYQNSKKKINNNNLPKGQKSRWPLAEALRRSKK